MGELIQELVKQGYLKTPEIIEAFKRVDRKNFVPERLKYEAYGNYPLPIGEGQTISQPLTVAFMLELLGPKEGDKILEIGSGSGWQTALLAELVGETGEVYAIERIRSLFEMTKRNVENAGYRNVTYLYGDGTEGHEPRAPYSKIIGAASAEEVPKAWTAQLAEGGALVFPLGASILRIRKSQKGQLITEEYPGYVFVPLIKD
jgi:protein-L-isoaspartate(D-aspartate) O-methyltransferase